MAKGTIQTQMNFKPSAIFVVERKLIGNNIAINSNASTAITVDISKTGYYPMSIMGWYVDNYPVDSASRGSAHTFYRLQCDGTNVVVGLKNNHSSMSGNVAAYVDILYIKVI